MSLSVAIDLSATAELGDGSRDGAQLNCQIRHGLTNIAIVVHDLPDGDSATTRKLRLRPMLITAVTTFVWSDALVI